jgi:hypothetical protein
MSSCKVPVILVRLLENLKLGEIFEKPQTKFMKIRPVGAELFFAGGRI